MLQGRYCCAQRGVFKIHGILNGTSRPRNNGHSNLDDQSASVSGGRYPIVFNASCGYEGIVGGARGSSVGPRVGGDTQESVGKSCVAYESSVVHGRPASRGETRLEQDKLLSDSGVRETQSTRSAHQLRRAEHHVTRSRPIAQQSSGLGRVFVGLVVVVQVIVPHRIGMVLLII